MQHKSNPTQPSTHLCRVEQIGPNGRRVTVAGDSPRELMLFRRGETALAFANRCPHRQLPLDWDEGWFASGGVEFLFNEKTTLRSGLAYEDSPIDAATSRTARVPDNDRVWVSFGITHKFSDMTTVGLGYTHIFVDDGPIDRVSGIPGAGQVRLLAESEQDFDIFAFSAKIRLGRPASSGPPLE